MNSSTLRLTLVRLATILICHLALASEEAASKPRSSAADFQLDAKARAIHARILTLDSHVDVMVPGALSEYGPNEANRADLAELRHGGIDAVSLAIAVGPSARTPEGVTAARNEADAKLRAIKEIVGSNSSELGLALSAADVRRLHDQGNIAVIESFLNARSLGSSLDGIDEFYNAGVHLVGFIHADTNDFADSSRPIGEPQKKFQGLSPLGKKAVEKLNQLGIIIDVSQLAPDGVLEVLKRSKAPVVASHSAVRALVDTARDLSV